jgi:hypothetical protein
LILSTLKLQVFATLSIGCPQYSFSQAAPNRALMIDEPCGSQQTAGGLESGAQRKMAEEEDREWSAKKRRQSPDRSCLPTTAKLPSAMNERGFRHVPA